MRVDEPDPADVPVAVIGAGTMGAGIAQVAAAAGHPVALYDVADEPLRRGRERIERFLGRGVEKGAVSAEHAAATLERVSLARELAELGGAAVVIEATPEVLELKRSVFEELGGVVAESALLASNTSTLSVAAIFAGVVEPERCCGMHFFNPAPLMPLVEIIRGPGTALATAERAASLARSWGKQPVDAADSPGFIVNRVARPFYGEALRLLGDGAADVTTVDRLVRDCGFPMGPFELMDLIGIDVNFAAAESVFNGFFGEPRFRPHPIQRAMVESGRLGRKTGLGYYDYSETT
ncbi:MAG: 3-hydroxyacyl-CoA dehydrogenase NAD-binding domain-containing protein [Anaerolineae bacterium]